MQINLTEFSHSVFAFELCSRETRPTQSGEYYRAGGDHHCPALSAEFPITLAGQPAHFRQETAHTPGDLSEIQTFQNPAASALLAEISLHPSFKQHLE